jgi:hypothetical protein
MTHTRNFSFLLAPVLLVSVTFAQTKGSPVDSSPDQVVAAHNRYTQPAEISPDTSDGAKLAQFQRRGPGAQFPRRGYPRASYGAPWQEPGNGRHAAIGALIGFGLGAALGAGTSKDSHTTVGAAVIFGGFGALIGGAVGGNHGAYPFAHRRRIDPPTASEDREANNRTGSSGTPAASNLREVSGTQEP